MSHYDVIIVGAGAAGIGMGVALQDLGVERYIILERHEVGASFRRWPRQMRFISPSFMSNGFGLVDLNAITFTTSPAYMLQQEHPSGEEYARYLHAVAEHYQLPIEIGLNVEQVQPIDEDGLLCHSQDANGFALRLAQDARERTLTCRYLIWAAGEFQYPNLELISGSEHCLHNATVRDWETVEGDDFVIIGGYESGIDAAVNLVARGKRVVVLDDAMPWAFAAPDPSLALSPYTFERLRQAEMSGRIELREAGVTGVTYSENGISDRYTVLRESGESIVTSAKPILATGFTGSLSLISDLLAWHPERYYAMLTAEDESAITPGLFLSGPFVRHDQLIFCFIYKFRQRFGVIANAIGERLGLDTGVLDIYRRNGFYLDDLRYCVDDCVCNICEE